MSAASDMHNTMLACSVSYRLANAGITIDGSVALDFNRYPFIPEILDEHAPIISIIKGAQMGFTIACIMRALEEAKVGGLRGIGYFFPTEGEVSDFAKARFSPMMTNNPAMWGNLVQDTDSAALKRIGDTFLYFRGMGQKGSGSAHRSTSKLKSIPLDRLYLDERDEMDDSRVDAAEHRLDGSLQPEQLTLSTPTLPEYGVDLEYRRSNQSVWMWHCDKCNEWTCLELTYPECIVEQNSGDPYYRCSNNKCLAKLDRVRGQWVARKPEIRDHIGYWVSQLSSPTKTAADILAAAERAQETGRRREFENQTLARAYAEVDEEITAEQLALLVDPERTKPLREEGPCAMGVDPGKPHWYTVRKRITEKDSQQIDYGRADSYEELSRIAKKYNVESGVMDKGYDPSAVDAFCKAHPGWYGGLYIGNKTTTADWNHSEREVKMGRTRTLDDAHATIVNKHVSYAQKTEDWEKLWVPQMTNLKRASVTINEATGETRAVWVVTGGQKNDHLRHADAYCDLALTRTSLAKASQRMHNEAAAASRPARRGRSSMSM